MSETIVFTGGGTAGHVTPNLAIIEALRDTNCFLHYIGSYSGIERDLLAAVPIPYHPIHTGKLRRYFSIKTLAAPFLVLAGMVQAFVLLGKCRATMVFSKGGFVAFPVVFAAWLRGIPVIAHESDMTPGLANRMSYPFVRTLCVNFEPTRTYFKNASKVICTGSPVRLFLLQGHSDSAYHKYALSMDKPCILIIGGSLGAQKLNRVVREALPGILSHAHVLHICGPGKVDPECKHPGYVQIEYAHEELGDIFAASSLVISRAGANAVYELLLLRKPHIFVPLSGKNSRGDQIDNAAYFEKQGISYVITDEHLNEDSLLEGLDNLRETLPERVRRMEFLDCQNATEKIVALLLKH
ncbi:MAG: undecaprenyldiphospho-muramoylpentapeptide beta-N-acetylglucosaminyltransferase [Legionellaceae bacterium]|nr:undecaprenyldiphospho-muramoylpentapeptide beta-N-acetylglucosaminyltransferase [Legionellaceae bacterium]